MARAIWLINDTDFQEKSKSQKIDGIDNSQMRLESHDHSESNPIYQIGQVSGKNPNIKIWGIDTYGSVFKKYHETGIFDENEIYPYITEGIGEDILPKNVNFEVIDGFTKVTDKDAAVFTRKLASEEAMFLGNSAGAVIKGLLQLKEHFTKDDVVVVLFHDHGSRYVGKMFNDQWMRDKGFIE